jgi:hypothetical protein
LVVSGNLNRHSTMKNNFTVFYSWQSDIRRNRNIIQTCLEKAIKEIIKKEHKIIDLEINIDRDTSNKSGSPEIANTIFQKIKGCDIFVCDVTIVNKNKLSNLFKYRLTPNPNVLIELGYAVNLLGWERIICINDIKFSKLEDLPFDIRGHRITSFQSSEQNFKDNLVSHLKRAVEFIISNYETIVEDQLKDSNKFHDLYIYNQIGKICSEVTLLDSLSLCINSLHINQLYLDHWDDLQEFYKLSINIFLDNELDALMKNFLKNLNDFDTIVVTYFHFNDKSSPEYLRYISMKVNGETLTEEEEFDYKQFQTYSPHKDPFHDETWADSDKRIHKLQDTLYEQGEKVKSSYREFVMRVKQTLM